MAAAGAARAAHHEGPLVDTHIHLFARDRKRWPLHPNAPYDPDVRDLEDYRVFVKKAGIAHSIIVHPEPYQDDHSYLSHCLENEPSPDFFKATCLFDAMREDTASRMRTLMRKHPGRIVALRVHAMGERGAPPEESGAIKNRDLTAGYMKRTWKAAADHGLAVQMHFKPFFAPQIKALSDQFRDLPVILDHLGRNGMGNPSDFYQVLRLAENPRVYMKFSGWPYSSNEDWPHRDLKPVVKTLFEAFGAERMIWGGLGYDMETFRARRTMLDEMFDYASEAERRAIRGETAMKLFALKHG